MSYKQKASANRDALFGSSTKSSSKKKRNAPAGKKGSGESLAAPAGSGRPASSTGYNYDGNRKKKNPVVTTLSGEAKTLKLKEAEEYRDKAKKSMQKGLFSKPDPLAASTFYKRAADAYQLCGEYRLERLYRINSADCQSTLRQAKLVFSHLFALTCFGLTLRSFVSSLLPYPLDSAGGRLGNCCF